MSTSKKGFTLAEVLLTLGIIGVVAALSIPVLVANVKYKQIESQLTKAYATMANAMRLSSDDNGPPETWPTGATMDVNELWLTHLMPYLRSAKLCKNMKACGYSSNYDTAAEKKRWSGGVGGNWVLKTSQSRLLFQLFDGTVVFMPRNSYGNNENDIVAYVSTVWIDVNGPKGPNTYCQDVFLFDRNTTQGLSPKSCTLWLHSNGWKFPKNYQWY